MSTPSTGPGGSGQRSGWAGSMGPAGSGVTSGTGGSSTTTGGTSTPAQITTIAIYQGVQINLMKDGMAVSKLNGPIVKNRPAMMRVWLEPGAGWAAHDVTAQLELSAGPKSQTVHVNGASVDSDLGTTFNFDLSADEMNVDMLTYAVTLHDPSATSDARWPATGTSSIAAKSSGAAIKIVYVPFNYTAGGPALIPDTSPAAIKKLDDALFAEYTTT